MYTESNKFVYDTIEASLLFWENCTKSYNKWATIETIIVGVL